jgi:hypothetical protein
MSLPANLTTNEVKNAAGTEEEFLQLSTDGRTRIFAKSGEVYSQPHRLTVSHQESGVGTAKRRRSVARVDKTIPGQVDTTKMVRITHYQVSDIPVGNLTSTTEVKNALANLISFMASLGASTTILYDCTGYGADALVNGTL